jgi:hypothetical protein
MLDATLKNCGYILDVKFARTFDEAMGFLGERFDIVAADWFLDTMRPSTETGFLFLQKYHGRHGEFKLNEGDLFLIAYSAEPDLIPENQGIYIIDRVNLVTELLDRVRKVAMLQGERSQKTDPGEMCMEHCSGHPDLVGSVSGMREDITAIKEALIGSLDKPGGLVNSVNALTEWKTEMIAIKRGIIGKLWGFAGGVILATCAALIVIAQFLKP